MAPLSWRRRVFHSSRGRFRLSGSRNKTSSIPERSHRYRPTVSPVGESSATANLQCLDEEMPDIEGGLDDQVGEEELEAELYQTIMAIDVKERGTVGCCYYVAREEKLYLLEDVAYAGTEIIETCPSQHLA